MRRRRGGSVLEIALFVPILFTLLVGMVQIGKITYVYYTLRRRCTPWDASSPRSRA